jgi:O-antigen/teichoic acid export membrane protein
MMRQLLKYGLTSFLMGSATILTTLYLRSLLIKRFGVAANGQYQVAYAISSSYLPFITNAIWGYFYPAMCALQNKDDINRELNQFVRFALFASTGIAALCVIFRYYIILVLYSKEFLPAHGLLAIQAVGDIFFILFYLLNTSLLARRKFRSTLLVSTLGYNIVLVALYMILASFTGCGIASLNMAIMLTNLFFAAGLILYHCVDTGFLPDSRNTQLLLKSAICVAFIYMIPGNEIWRILVKMLIGGAWLISVFTRDEFKRFREVLLSYFKRRAFSA